MGENNTSSPTIGIQDYVLTGAIYVWTPTVIVGMFDGVEDQ